jgi:hypothetical protein
MVAGAATAAAESWWPFDSHPKGVDAYAHPTFWQLLFSDRTTLGLARLAVLALAAYVFTSVPALAIVGRWLKVFGAQGLTADAAEDAKEAIKSLDQTDVRKDKVIAELKETLDQMRTERDAATRRLDEVRQTLEGMVPPPEPPSEQPRLDL